MTPAQVASPNHGARRDGLSPCLIVLHYTGMESVAAAMARLCDPAAAVSAHYLIAPDGALLPLVDERQRAWHAGQGSWQGRGDVNSRSIGVELANTGAEPFPEPQMHALETLLRALMDRWQIAPSGVIGHSDMAPERKHDPGARFDWRRLARLGLAFWPAGQGDAAAPLTPSLDAIGYPPAAPDARLRAFRLRFRPHAHGPECAADRAMADAAARGPSTMPAPACCAPQFP